MIKKITCFNYKINLTSRRFCYEVNVQEYQHPLAEAGEKALPSKRDVVINWEEQKTEVEKAIDNHIGKLMGKNIAAILAEKAENADLDEVEKTRSEYKNALAGLKAKVLEAIQSKLAESNAKITENAKQTAKEMSDALPQDLKMQERYRSNLAKPFGESDEDFDKFMYGAVGKFYDKSVSLRPIDEVIIGGVTSFDDQATIPYIKKPSYIDASGVRKEPEREESTWSSEQMKSALKTMLQVIYETEGPEAAAAKYKDFVEEAKKAQNKSMTGGANYMSFVDTFHDGGYETLEDGGPNGEVLKAAPRGSVQYCIDQGFNENSPDISDTSKFTGRIWGLMFEANRQFKDNSDSAGAKAFKGYETYLKLQEPVIRDEKNEDTRNAKIAALQSPVQWALNNAPEGLSILEKRVILGPESDSNQKQWREYREYAKTIFTNDFVSRVENTNLRVRVRTILERLLSAEEDQSKWPDLVKNHLANIGGVTNKAQDKTRIDWKKITKLTMADLKRFSEGSTTTTEQIPATGQSLMAPAASPAEDSASQAPAPTVAAEPAAAPQVSIVSSDAAPASVEAPKEQVQIKIIKEKNKKGKFIKPEGYKKNKLEKTDFKKLPKPITEKAEELLTKENTDKEGKDLGYYEMWLGKNENDKYLVRIYRAHTGDEAEILYFEKESAEAKVAAARDSRAG
ncbi:MAG: hypothetical protein WC843_00555 [Candidatus Gracilibacteria bacterium]|jgi:hypothetical protein